ncbi:PQQ-like beta-propeller repeat protein [Streptomyces sp. KE1]|uniref:PQQ-like beta-propeller repeat protein n=1 Tax=Streptomyces sp. KE1 TaxID=1638939 RepID=UPI00099D0ADA|nr:PQQ-like beta-propeller repeat protein [Streptomyces sp. KE1]
MPVNASASASPYSTGGGGTVFEHHYGAVLLSHLLTRTPVPGLGDEVTPVEVRFQARAVTAVDDYLVTGHATNGSQHYMSVAARRRPKLAASDSSSVELIKSFLTTLHEQWTSLDAGRWHLALAVAAPFPRAASLQALTTTAVAASGSASVFRELAAEPGRLNRAAHRALKELEALVASAVNAGAPNSGLASDTLTWRLLAHLSILDLRLEGVRPEDRTAAVERLQPVASLGAAADGSALYSRLRECASTYAPAGATVTRESLLRALSGWALSEPPSPVRQDKAARSFGPRSISSQRRPRALWSRTAGSLAGARQPQVYGGTLLVVAGYTLHAFDAESGGSLWSMPRMGHSNQPPVDGNTVFASGLGSTLRPRNIRSGTEIGPRVENCATSQAVCNRGTLYVPDLNGVLHAYDAVTGRWLWGKRPDPGITKYLEAPRVLDGSVFATWNRPGPSSSWAIQALNAETGEPRWPKPLELTPPQHWLVSKDRLVTIALEPYTGTPFITTYDTHSGALLWQGELTDQVVGRPTVSGNLFHLAHSDGHVSSWDALTGENIWTRKIAKTLRTHPVAAGEQVLITSWDPGRLTALNSADGTIVWQGSARPTAALMTPAYLTGEGAWAVSRAGVLQGWALGTGRRLPASFEDLLWDPSTQGIPPLWHGDLYVVTGNGNLHAIHLGGAK